MKLNAETLSVTEQLEEFDQWLTAKLDRIKDTSKFNNEINALCNCILTLAPYLQNFIEPSTCSIDSICHAVIESSYQFIQEESFLTDEAIISSFYESFFNLLFLTTGATDNNLKNHFLIKLNEDGIKPFIPKRGAINKNITFKLIKIPSTTKSDFIARTLASYFVGSNYIGIIKTEPYFDLSTYLNTFLKEYIKLILEDDSDILQFWAICHSFLQLNNSSADKSLGKYLLNSCTIFKVRGSVSASGGHITEDILRDKLSTIGLKPETDFNTNDVIIGNHDIIEDGKRKKKTRAYDFVIPYRIERWEPKPKLFIQSQFYAGDSGSVSHKVVDQTQSSRAFTIEKYPTARFVEYLDGAGYYASLRGDLEHMLSFSDTASFFQVKSILIRLRRELQKIDFLTAIEIQHAILISSNPTLSIIESLLENDGYTLLETRRAIDINIELGFIKKRNDGLLTIPNQHLTIARALLTLDIAANNSSRITDSEKSSQKYLLIPGYGPNMGILESKLTQLVCDACKQTTIIATDFIRDIEWLLDEGVLKRS